MTCRVPLCNRKAIPHAIRCETHQKQLMDRVLKAPKPR